MDPGPRDRRADAWHASLILWPRTCLALMILSSTAKLQLRASWHLLFTKSKIRIVFFKICKLKIRCCCEGSSCFHYSCCCSRPQLLSSLLSFSHSLLGIPLLHFFKISSFWLGVEESPVLPQLLAFQQFCKHKISKRSMLAILDDQAVIIHGHSEKVIERVIVMRTQMRHQVGS